VLDGALPDRVPVLVEGIHHVVIERWSEGAEIRCVLVALDEQDMVRIHLPDGAGDAHIEIAKVVPGHALRQDGLVDEVVADDERLVGVADRNLTPDLDGPILVRFGLGPEPRHPVAVAYIARILRAGRRVHVQDDVQAVGAAPSEKRIEELEALLANFLAFRIPEVEIVEWQPDVVVAPFGDRKSTRLNSSHVKISYA